MSALLCISSLFFFFFNDTATTEIYTLSLHDALPISWCSPAAWPSRPAPATRRAATATAAAVAATRAPASSRSAWPRSEEHTSELQSRQYLVCRLLLEKKKKHNEYNTYNLTTIIHIDQ